MLPSRYWLLAIMLLLVRPTAAEEVNLPALAKKLSGSVFQVETFDQSGSRISIGTGFFVENRAITNHHVIKDASRIVCVLPNGNLVEAKGIVAASPGADLAELAISIAGPSLRLRTTAPIVGEKVVVYGSPKGLTGTLSEGIVSARREMDGFEFVQISAPISAGSSGSPVTDSRGNVIGIATLIRQGGQALNFAVASSEISQFLFGRKSQPEQPSPVTESERKVIEELEIKAQDAFQNRNYAGLLKAQKKLYELEPNSLMRAENLADAYALTQMYEEAEKLARDILKADPDRELPWIILALYYGYKGDHLNRIEHLEIARKISPNSGRADGLLAIIYRHAGLHSKADACAKREARLSQEWMVEGPAGVYTGARGTYFDLESIARVTEAELTKGEAGSVFMTNSRGRVRFDTGSPISFSDCGPALLSAPIIRFGDRFLMHPNDLEAVVDPVLQMQYNPAFQIPRFVLLPYPATNSPLRMPELKALAAEINKHSNRFPLGRITAGDSSSFYRTPPKDRPFAIFIGTAGPSEGKGVFRPPLAPYDGDNLQSSNRFNSFVSMELNSALAIDSSRPGKFQTSPSESSVPRLHLRGPLRTATIDPLLHSDSRSVGVLVDNATLQDPIKRKDFVRRFAGGLDWFAPDKKPDPIEKLARHLAKSATPLRRPQPGNQLPNLIGEK